MMKTFTCEKCGDSFERKWHTSWPVRKFCSPKCRYAAAKENPDLLAACKRANEASRVSEKSRQYLHSGKNPFSGATGEKIRARGNETNKERGYPELNGGNGVLTTPELLLRQLGSEFTPEFSAGLGQRQPGYPTNYKVDLGCPRLKLAIELDGNSHRQKRRQELDRKKDQKLTSLGWTVLRFSNTEALKNPSGICQQVRETMSRLES